MRSRLVEASPSEWPAANKVLEALDKERRAGSLDVAFRWAAHFLTVSEVSELVWNWLIVQSEGADLKYRCALTVGVFELLTDEPFWRKKLFSLLARPRLWWIFLDLYEETPEKLYESLKEVYLDIS